MQVVEPKKAKLREAEEALADANRKLAEKQAMLKEVRALGLTGPRASPCACWPRTAHSDTPS